MASNKSSLYNPDSPQSSLEPRQELASFLDKQFRRKMSYDQVYEILDNCNIPWVYCLITPTLDPSQTKKYVQERDKEMAVVQRAF